MSYSKSLPILGGAGSVSISESGGVAGLSLSISESAGGGNVKGFMSVGVSVNASISALQLMDAGMDIAAAKFPQFAAEIALIKAALDAEAAKL